MLSGRGYRGRRGQRKDIGDQRAGHIYEGAGRDSLPTVVWWYWWCNGVETFLPNHSDPEGWFRSQLPLVRPVWKSIKLHSLKKLVAVTQHISESNSNRARRVLWRRPMSRPPRHWWVLSSPYAKRRWGRQGDLGVLHRRSVWSSEYSNPLPQFPTSQLDNLKRDCSASLFSYLGNMASQPRYSNEPDPLKAPESERIKVN